MMSHARGKPARAPSAADVDIPPAWKVEPAQFSDLNISRGIEP